LPPKLELFVRIGEVNALMPKKKPAAAKPKEPEPEPVEEEEEVTCPVCGKSVGLEVTECPHCGAAFEEEEIEEVIQQKPAPSKQSAKAVVEEPLEVEETDEEMAACPVCGKMVGLSAPSCPSCGAEFQEEEVEEPVVQKAAVSAPKPVVEEPVEAEPVGDDEMAECPVCGKMVSLNISSCPNCGAEFEEEVVEEVIEVEEAKTAPRAEPSEVEEEPAVVEEEQEFEPVELETTSILDLRVIGVALIVLGIIGAQIAFMIDWYWTWVPPIENNLAMFIGLAAVVVVIGLLVFMLIKKAAGSGKKVPRQAPGMSLSLFLFGIMALVLVMLWNPINDALQSSRTAVGVAFVVLLVVGVAMYFVKIRTESGTPA
jgi:predicted amidophosphoribosyltransferase